MPSLRTAFIRTEPSTHPFRHIMGGVAVLVLLAANVVSAYGATSSSPAARSTAVSAATATPTRTATPSPTSTPTTGPPSVVVNVPPSESWWKTLLAALGGGATTALITWIVASRSFWQRANEEEIKRLQTGLDEFYGPFMRLLDVTFLLSQDLRDRLNDPGYRMLLKLTDQNWLKSLPTGNRAIVEEVIANDAQLEALILTKSGGRVDDDVADYLSHAVAHFRMIKRAMNGQLAQTDQEMLKPYVFPTHLRTVMRLQRNWIQRRIETLKGALYKSAPLYTPLKLSQSLKAPTWPDPDRADVASTPFSPPSDGEKPTV